MFTHMPEEMEQGSYLGRFGSGFEGVWNGVEVWLFDLIF